jgi:hypothetical protein
MVLRREKAGVFVSDWRNLGLDGGHAQWAWNQGFRYIVFHGHAGSSEPQPYGHVPTRILDWCRAKGFDVGCWGSFDTDNDPVANAQAANGIRAANNYSFYVANIEVPFNDEKFITEFRRIAPRFTMWLSSEISNPRNWKAWFGTPAKATCWQPQCYMNVNPGATPEQAMFWATRTDGHGFGIPSEMVKPTVGMYDPKNVSVEKYIDELAKIRNPGFSVWLGETMTAGEFLQFGKGIREKGIALI